MFDPRQLRAERPYKLVRSLAGDLREFEYQIDMDRFLRIVCPDRLSSGVARCRVLLYDKQTSAVAIRGRIDEQHPSVIAAIDAAGETIQLAMALAEMFAGQIDFDSDLQPGDTFEVLFEKSTHDGQFAGYGPILGARFVADGREHQAFRWTDPASAEDRVLRRERPLAEALLPALAAQVRAAGHIRLLEEPPPSRAFAPTARISASTMPRRPAAPVVAVSSGTVVSAGWSGGGGQHGAPPARERLRELLPPPVRVRAGHPSGGARRTRGS